MKVIFSFTNNVFLPNRYTLQRNQEIQSKKKWLDNECHENMIVSYEFGHSQG